MNTNTLHYISHLHILNLYIYYCFTAGYMYPPQAQTFAWWWDKVTQFSSEWKTHKDFVLEREDVNFSTNIKFLWGGDMEINSLVNLQVFLHFPKFLSGKNKADQT